MLRASARADCTDAAVWSGPEASGVASATSTNDDAESELGSDDEPRLDLFSEDASRWALDAAATGGGPPKSALPEDFGTGNVACAAAAASANASRRSCAERHSAERFICVLHSRSKSSRLGPCSYSRQCLMSDLPNPSAIRARRRYVEMR